MQARFTPSMVAAAVMFSNNCWRHGVVVQSVVFDDHDRKVDGSTPTQASLLRPWIRCFAIIISAWWNLTSSKLKNQKQNSTGKVGKQEQLLSESGFVLCIAPPSPSRDKKIKMKKSHRIKS